MEMRRMGSSLALAAALAGSLADRALAIGGPTGIPSAVNSTVPPMLRLVSVDGLGTPSPSGRYRVVVRDFFNNPIQGSLVILEFLNCSGVVFASSGYPAGITADCRPTHRTVRRITNAQGEADFVVPGTAVPGQGNSTQCLKVYAEGTWLADVSVSTADLSGADGVGANDLSLWLQAFAIGDASLADLDGSGGVGANDLSEWLSIFGSGLELATPSALCP